MTGQKKLSKDSNAAENVIDLDEWSDWSPSPGTPLSPIFCVKNVEKMKELEKKEDCFILDFDPDRPSLVSQLSHKFDNLDACDISVVAEKGQVACRDYPHSRHVCLKYPFEKTPHHDYCQLCYCFVCDTAAPCKQWTGVPGHCHAVDNEAWNRQRENTRKTTSASVNKC